MTVGTLSRRDVLKEGRADYGERFCRHCRQNWCRAMAAGLVPGTWRARLQFAKIFPDDTIVAALSQQLSSSHSVELSSSNNPMILVQVSHIWRGSIAYTFMPESATSRRSKADMREPRGGN